MTDPERRAHALDRRKLLPRLNPGRRATDPAPSHGTRPIRLVGGRGDGLTVTPRYLGAFLERPIEFRRAGIFIERYALTAGWQAVYTGLRRSGELPRHFKPERLPA